MHPFVARESLEIRSERADMLQCYRKATPLVAWSVVRFVSEYAVVGSEHFIKRSRQCDFLDMRPPGKCRRCFFQSVDGRLLRVLPLRRAPEVIEQP